jgi:hypothetical protein
MKVDGEGGDRAKILVKNAVAQSRSDAPFTVFVLAIGEQVSTALCQGIAEAGNGVCLWATTAERIVDKCAALVQAGSTFTLQNISIDWGLPSRDLGESQFDSTTPSFPKSETLRQAPSVLSVLRPNMRLTVYALVQGEPLALPKKVTLYAQRDGSGPQLTFELPVKQVKFEAENTRTRLLHTLAAKQLISELQDSLLVESKPGPSDTALISSVISLAERYQLISRYTSFVTEIKDSPDLEFPWSSHSLRALRHQHMSAKLSRFSISPHRDQPRGSVLQRAVYYAKNLGFTLLNSLTRQSALGSASPVPISLDLRIMPGHLSDDGQDSIVSRHSAIGSLGDQEPSVHDLDDSDSESDGTFTTISSLVSSVTSGPYSEYSRPSSLLSGSARSASPVVDTRSDHLPTTMGPLSRLPSPPPQPLEYHVSDLISMMHYDGSFVESPGFESIIGRSAIEKGQDFPAQLWISALALGYLRKYLRSNRGLLEPVIGKVMSYIDNASKLHPTLTVEKLLEKASAALSL